MTEAQQELMRNRARNLRCKRTMVSGLNVYDMDQWLQETSEQISEIEWIGGQHGGIRQALAELIGSEDEAAEFQTCFAILQENVDRMLDDLQELFSGDEYDESNSEVNAYDDFLVACRAGADRNSLMGYDGYEDDYFRIDNEYTAMAAVDEAKTRLKRLTKDQIIEEAHRAFQIVINFMALEQRYDDLRAALDMLQGTYGGQLEIMGKLSAEYEKQITKEDWEQNWRTFDRTIQELPAQVWLE